MTPIEYIIIGVVLGILMEKAFAYFLKRNPYKPTSFGYTSSPYDEIIRRRQERFNRLKPEYSSGGIRGSMRVPSMFEDEHESNQPGFLKRFFQKEEKKEGTVIEVDFTAKKRKS